MLFTKVIYLDNTYHIPFKDNVVYCNISKDKFNILFDDGTEYYVYTNLLKMVGDFSHINVPMSRPELTNIKNNLINAIMAI